MCNKENKIQQIIIIIIFLGLVLISIWSYNKYILNPTPSAEDTYGEPCSSEVGGSNMID